MALPKDALLLLSGVLVFIAAPTLAQDAEEGVGTIEVPSEVTEMDEIIVEGEVVKDEVVCKRTKPPTASRISRSKKICKKKSQWDAEQRAMRERNSEIYRNQALNSGIEQSNAQNSARGGPSPR